VRRDVILFVLLVALRLIELHGPEGQRIFINPEEVTSVREPRGLAQGHFPRGVRCLIYLTNRNFITVTEDCDTVRQRLQQTGDSHAWQ
jgi:hypothetical protein